MRKATAAVAVLALTWASPLAQDLKVPTYEQIIDLKRPGGTAISPEDRKSVV